MTRQLFRLLAALLCVCLLPVNVHAEEAGEAGLFTQTMVERSLTAVGNTTRLHRAIDKARAGEEVTIVYLGGSITEGASAKPQATKCYAYLSAQMFADKFMADPSKLNYVNAGISGTPSLLGITRAEQDVLVHEPDIVFVEFAVNDANDPTSQMVYESLVRKLLMSDSQPAVILVFTLLNSGYSCQPHMMQVGKHYDLGMISVKDAIQPSIARGEIKWADYSADYAHPTTQAHAFVASLIGHYFDQAAAVPAQPWTMPEAPRYGSALEALQNLRKDDPRIIDTGAFPFGPVSCYSYTQGWRHTSAAFGTDPLVVEVTGSRMTFAYKQERNTMCGKVEIWVDGVRKQTLNGYADNAWGNVVTVLVDLGGSGEHRVELRLPEGEDTKRFNLLDMAVAP